MNADITVSHRYAIPWKRRKVMAEYCNSCGMPIEKGMQEKRIFCQYCADEKGALHPKEAVQKGIAQWLQSWAPKDDKGDFMKRAEAYMSAMPAWALRK